MQLLNGTPATDLLAATKLAASPEFEAPFVGEGADRSLQAQWSRDGQEIVFVASPQSGDCTAGKEKSFQLAGNKVYWAQTSEEQQAWRCVRGVNGKLVRLTVATAMPPTTYADVGLGTIDASARRIR